MSKKKSDIDKRIEEYSEMEDFGFSAGVDTSEFEERASSAEEQLNDLQDAVNDFEIENDVLKKRLKKAERLIMPLLSKLAKTADESDTIYWPNRKELLESKIEEFLEITDVDDE